MEPLDFRYASALGYEIKLLAYSARPGGRIEARVHPAMIPLHHPLATGEGAFNAVQITGDLVGDVLLWGQGAGGRPTASAVVGDLLDAAHSIREGFSNQVGGTSPRRAADAAHGRGPDQGLLPASRTR